jgi:hypothetical protein
MRVVRTLSFEGRYVDSRLHGTTARIVLSSFPRGPEARAAPARPGTTPPRVERQLQAIASSSLLTDHRSGAKRRACWSRARRRSASRAGAAATWSRCSRSTCRAGCLRSTPTLLTSCADVVYASRANLYVVSQLFRGRDSAQAIHKLGAGRGPVTAYRASGEVAGWSTSSRALRAPRVTARGHHRAEVRAAQRELRERPRDRCGQLRRVGRVGNPRPRGGDPSGPLHRGRRVRGDVPADRSALHLDLASPSRPRVIRQPRSAVTRPTCTWSARTCCWGWVRTPPQPESSWDPGVAVRHPTCAGPGAREQPAEIGVVLGGRFDHHAFLYWPPARLAVTPVEVFAKPGGTPARAGAFGLGVGRGVGVERGRPRDPSDRRELGAGPSLAGHRRPPHHGVGARRRDQRPRHPRAAWARALPGAAAARAPYLAKSSERRCAAAVSSLRWRT